MKLTRRKDPNAEEQEIDVTPLVDCVFLLLSFFMVSSSMKGNPDHNIPAAVHGVGVDPRGSTEVRIIAADPSPIIMLNNRESSLEEVRPFVEQGLQKGHNMVVVKADRDIQHGFVQKVARAAAAVEGVRLSLGVQDKKAE